MGLWAEQLVIVKQNKTDVYPQPDKNDIFFPSLYWYGENKLTGGICYIEKEKRRMSVSLSFPKNKRID